MQIYAAAIEKHLFDMHEAQTKFIPNVSPQPAYHRWTAVVSKGGNSNANVKSMDRMGIESYELGISIARGLKGKKLESN